MVLMAAFRAEVAFVMTLWLSERGYAAFTALAASMWTSIRA